jgi:glycosyltransferase involved in cell wall biosynthesis
MTADSPDDASLVSVVITTYNRPSYLARAVESVHGQTYDPLELVVVDDCSDTPAESVLADLSVDLGRFHEVTCIRHEENRGANAARNTGVRAASGEYVAFLDDDDRWRPEKTARPVEAFAAAGEETGVVYTGVVATHGEDRETKTPPAVDGDLTKALLCRNVVGTLSAVMVRTDLAEAVPLDEGFPSWADLEWYIRLSRRAAFARLPEPLVVYEFDSHNRLSSDFEKKLVAYERFVETFDETAAAYGPLFRRKMRAWAAYRVGSTALYAGEYGHARRLLGTAVARYPFNGRFLQYFAATLGGRYSHGLARKAKRLARHT